MLEISCHIILSRVLEHSCWFLFQGGLLTLTSLIMIYKVDICPTSW